MCSLLDCFVAIAPRNDKGKAVNMKTLLTILGVILLLSGLVWMGQGSGYFPYPAESFMVGARQWIYYGGAVAVIGLGIIIFARR